MKVYFEPRPLLARICTDGAAGGPMPGCYVGTASITMDDLRVATVPRLVLPGYGREARDTVIGGWRVSAARGAMDAAHARRDRAADRACPGTGQWPNNLPVRVP